MVRPPDRRTQRTWVPVAAGWLCLLIGLADIIQVVRPSLYTVTRLHKIHAFVPGTLTDVEHTLSVIIGLLLLMLSHGLRRRKRRAWEAVTLLLAASAVVHLIHPRHDRIITAIVSAVLLAALLYFRREFYAVGDPRTRWRALWVFCGLVVADVAIGLTYILLAKGLQQNYSLWQRTVHVVYGLVGVTGPVQFVPESRGDLFTLLTSCLGLFTLIVTAYLFFRPARPAGRLGQQDNERVRDLLRKQGDRDSLGYFTLRSDKSVIWSPTGKSCIGYRVVSGVMLAGGDPLGDPEAWPGAIHAFLDEAARHAWVPAVMGCGELAAEVWCREGGLTALELGDEAIVEVAGFSLKGRSMRNVRQMVNRVERSGYTAQVRRVRDIPREEIAAFRRVAGSWRGNPTERGFSMALGRMGVPGDEDCVIATAHENGVLRAILHFVPWGPDGLSLDLMRRDRTAQPGVIDFLIVETLKAAGELEVKRISLNFAVFRSALERGERIGAGPVLRAWRGILLFASRWFQIESLYKFNAKFGPTWVPRFFVWPGTRDTPRVALAALEAEAFLVWPKLELRRMARRLGLGRARRRLTGRSRPAPTRVSPVIRPPADNAAPGTGRPSAAGTHPAGAGLVGGRPAGTCPAGTSPAGTCPGDGEPADEPGQDELREDTTPVEVSSADKRISG
ncbi:MAG TPA: phosphatidylglycerol lysyltransferase domain-containing protein [Streptosporangiaceae bacterium]|nr:phosphatidylglycerol lysyltransferase domain-containing protein [Streptosporangiaceae bacterium]